MRYHKFLKVIGFTLALGWLISPILNAQNERAVFNDDDNYRASSIKGPSDKDNLQDYVVVNGEKCENPSLPETFKDGKDLGFLFKDHVVVHSGKEKSRCIVLKDLPFSGYYRARVVAMYSKDGGVLQQNEQYRLVVVTHDSTFVFDTIIPDQNDFDSTKYDSSLKGVLISGSVIEAKSDYDYYLNDYGFIPLKKGDNTIRFYAVDQFLGEGQGEHNSVDFYSIELTPPPFVIAEPPFTAGHSNTIHWLGVDEGAIANEVIYYGETHGLQKSNAQSLGNSSAVSGDSTTFNGLADGQKYYFYLQSFTDSGDVVRSDTTFSTQDAAPPGRVGIISMSSLGNQMVKLFWNAAADAGSGVKEYHVVRSEDNSMETAYSVIDTVAAASVCADSSPDSVYYCFVDHINDPNAMKKKFKYRIDAVDSVGNISSGFESELVVRVPPPELKETVPPIVLGRFYQGAQVTLKADVSMLELPASHKIKFQVARENAKFFDGQFGVGKYFFESGWLPLTEAMKDITYTFDLTGGGAANLQFIDGHRYLFRAQLQDLQGNKSLWAFDPDSSFVIPDCFPADDITFLDLKAVTNDSNTQGQMELSWGGAIDYTSGIEKYLVYRKKNTDSTDNYFDLINTTLVPYYSDRFDSIKYNGDVTYRIGSVDRVGNKRDSLETAYEASARSQSAPIWNMVNVDTANGRNYLIKDHKLQISISLEKICLKGQQFKLLAKLNGKDHPVLRVHDSNSDSLGWGILLPTEVGEDTISLRTQFSDKTTSLWSQPQVVRYDTSMTHESITKLQSQKAKATNFPNPFNLSTTISYILEKDSYVNVDIYNIQGRKIRSLANEYMGRGRHSLIWDGYNAEGNVVSSGIFYFKIQIENENGDGSSIYQKMLLIK